ncbi:DUF1573 domain-containing protein [uncultured Sunxiuqinia sp.]|uniref:DUF1573 domain-containing protein n=1 Tax=uncultured Sunxiuqinia sp. TaxID=1573825 RepID=UPI0026205609|nr:DUF1573 domain-containing protein [uncultured Sunxiuqinia sp.]
MKYLATICVLLIALSCQNSSRKGAVKTSTKTGTPKFEIQERFYNFGQLQAGEVVAYSFHFTNSGDGALLIEKVETDCGCLNTHFPKEPVAPGESGYIEVVFNSAGETGRVYKELQVVANTQPEITKLAVAATVENELINLYSKN